MGLQSSELSQYLKRHHTQKTYSNYTEPSSPHKLQQKQRLEKTAKILHKIQPRLLSHYLNWYIAIEPETGVYFLDSTYTGIFLRSKIYFPKRKLSIYQLNSSNYMGKI